MRPSRKSYDVVVVGGGPVGTVTAVAHARAGARVLLLEADPRAARRFAGEWLHPMAVEMLDELRMGRLESARARAGYGFVIVPGDGGAPIEMPYGRGVALSAEHGAIVEALREVASVTQGLEYLAGARAIELRDGAVLIEDRATGVRFEVRAGRVVGADGRRSMVRESLGLPGSSSVLSSMLSVELRGVSLPREGFGHVILGGPGPALFYRISDDVVRGCLDMPAHLGAGARTREIVWDRFAPVVPEQLRDALRAALESGPCAWAVNRFRPRTSFGRGEVALVGDAVGHVHPMTAIGMTMGFLDARALAASRSVEEYAKRRRAYVPELLSNALYHCFRRDDESASELRRAMFRTLRADEGERSRTMDIMAGADARRRSFGSAFLRIAAQAVGQTVAEKSRGRMSELPSALAALGEWMQWPAALAVPQRLRWLAGRAFSGGGFAGSGGTFDRVASVRALRALVSAGTHDELIARSARRLAAELVRDPAPSWQDARELLESLALSVARGAPRPRRARSVPSLAGGARAPIEGMLGEDWAFCKQSLAEVSRTFARPIALLPPRLELAVTLGYLLCRIADTIEDHVAVDPAMRDELFGLFLRVLEHGADPKAFSDAFERIEGADAELSLARSLARVMRMFETQALPLRGIGVRWVAEMARGMSLYAHRAPGEDGIAALHTVSDLERYCFYVAGTVGHLLTDLFVYEMGVPPDGALAVALRDRCEGFATGLQLTNILKDVTDDFARAVSFVPRNECARQGLPVARLLDPALRGHAHAAVSPMFELARARLDDALEYALTIPAAHPQIRLFCLLPAWMAARTSVLARGSDAMFTPDEPVKISRSEVEALIAECVHLVGDDAALRVRYRALFDAPAQAPARVG